MATEFVQQTVRRSLAGAAVGAGLGAGVGVLYQFTNYGDDAESKGNDAAPKTNTGTQFPDLYADADVYYLTEDMKEFRHNLPDAFDSMLSGLDRLCALHTLVHAATVDDFKASWAVTAHHHAETIRDALREMALVVKDPASSAEIEERSSEIEDWVGNTVHNVSMQVQTRLLDGV